MIGWGMGRGCRSTTGGYMLLRAFLLLYFSFLGGVGAFWLLVEVLEYLAANCFAFFNGVVLFFFVLECEV